MSEAIKHGRMVMPSGGLRSNNQKQIRQGRERWHSSGQQDRFVLPLKHNRQMGRICPMVWLRLPKSLFWD